jgi:HemX protein
VVQDRNLRRHRFNRWFLQLPSLAALDRWALFSSALGFFLLFVAMAIGEEWAQVVLHHWILGSLKTVVTLLTWAMYAVYLIQRVRRQGTGRGLMAYQMICFVATVVNLVAVADPAQFPVRP